jgi:hypothetical protein
MTIEQRPEFQLKYMVLFNEDAEIEEFNMNFGMAFMQHL